MRGTTPTHTFKLKIDTSMLAVVSITYKQDDEVILKKSTAECTLDGNKVSTTLTQEETFLFDENKLVRIQLRGLTHGGQAIKTRVHTMRVSECLDEEVLET